jgi:hypothetical protein
MGERPVDFNRHWRRHRLDDVAERLGSNLAVQQKADSLDGRERKQRNGDAGNCCVAGETIFSDVASELRAVSADAVFYGRRKPFSPVGMSC